MQITNRLTKDFIFRNVSQEEIFERYTNIPIGIIEDCISSNKLVKSPFRYDPNPSVGFKYDRRDKLKMKDFAGYFWGDCFDAVCKVMNRSNSTNLCVSNKEGFMAILTEIATEFDLLDGVPTRKTDIKTGLYKIKKELSVIDVEIREYSSKCDKYYWLSKYHNLLTFRDLYNNNIYPVERYWIDSDVNPEAKYYFTNNDPCYAYYEGVMNGTHLYRLYFPARSKDYNTHLPKFISNNQSLQRLNVFDNYNEKFDRIIISKSKKDAIILDKLIRMSNLDYFFFTGLKIAIIAYPQENYKLSQAAYNWLLSKLIDPNPLFIISFLDFDKVGRSTSIYTYRQYEMPYLFLTNGLFGLPNYGSKDISDYLEKNGIDSTLNLIKMFLNGYSKNE